MANRRGKGKLETTASVGPRGWGEFVGVALLALGILTLGGLFSYQTGATAWMGPVGQLTPGWPCGWVATALRRPAAPAG